MAMNGDLSGLRARELLSKYADDPFQEPATVEQALDWTDEFKEWCKENDADSYAKKIAVQVYLFGPMKSQFGMYDGRKLKRKRENAIYSTSERFTIEQVMDVLPERINDGFDDRFPYVPLFGERSVSDEYQTIVNVPSDRSFAVRDDECSPMDNIVEMKEITVNGKRIRVGFDIRGETTDEIVRRLIGHRQSLVWEEIGDLIHDIDGSDVLDRYIRAVERIKRNGFSPDTVVTTNPRIYDESYLSNTVLDGHSARDYTIVGDSGCGFCYDGEEFDIELIDDMAHREDRMLLSDARWFGNYAVLDDDAFVCF